ncbi:hypothetical protein IFR05_007596 [Cadophora sp. M221]|nr:hypothetical protein IFR05_007596 [Cadophora sp. M221]
MKKLVKRILGSSRDSGVTRTSSSQLAEPEDSSDVDTPLCAVCLDFNWERYERDPEDKGDEFAKRHLEVPLELMRNSVGCSLCEGVAYAVMAFGELNTAVTSKELSPDVKLGLSLLKTGKAELEVRDGDRWVIIFCLDFYIPVGLPSTCRNFRVSPELPSILDVEIAASFVTSHLDVCNSTHLLCRAKDFSMPSRLVYVPPKDGRKSIRLIENLHSRQNYVTLSHCWGELSSLSTTTKSSMKARLDKIVWNDLPKTFQDAISLVQKLKIEYIWIDSLCIIQDDDEDWKRESVKMAEIYSQAYLTISATCASNGQVGCFPPRWHRTNHGAMVPYSAVGPISDEIFSRFGFTARFCPSSHGHIFLQSPPESGAPLWLRAWAFQERTLSTRTIHFHGEEMIWECHEALSCECGQFCAENSSHFLSWGNSGSVRLATTGSRSRSTGLPDPMKGWFSIVSTFSKLDITFESDRLPAISGIANVMSNQFKESYIAGIWGSELARGLLWSQYGHQKSIRVAGTPRCYVPTWTWASAELVLRKSDGLMSSRANLHADPCFSSPSFESRVPVIKPIVEREEAAIQVRGKTITCSLRNRHKRSSDDYPEHELTFQGETCYVILDVMCTVEDEDVNDHLEVLCLLVGISDYDFYPIWERRYIFLDPYIVQYGLVLQKTSTGQYTRVGVLEIDSRKDWFAYSKLQTVEII